ncbi:hypothetical protein GDO78_014557 [Eleutherodactylus coqui]|uniref:Ig-like domain-containing protein n=1 Tax=Eleutherodactylus coqui TaxID=57060 RepID=A0A8J6K180_ELECQ|nr:hypothetical protein GDO78_014557 [Eleutherodactylus coqui]
MADAVCLAADVIQKPPLHLALPTDSVTISCKHDDSSYYNKYWYRQKKGKELVLIGYTISDTLTMEAGFTDGKLNIQPNGTRTGLIISNASTNDSAVYYCASSIHSEVIL